MSVSRRQFLKTAGAAAAVSVFGRYATRRAFAQGVVNSLGVTLPADAAPLEQQVLKWPNPVNNILTGEWFRSNYRLIPGSLYIQEPLVRVDKELRPLPAGAESWSLSEDGLTWTFNLVKGQEWSDGVPLTAHDWVYSFRLGADPNTGYDFAWYYNLVKNWDAVNRGDLPLEDLGVAALDDYTFTVTTEVPRPYIPAWIGFAGPGPAHAEAKYGKDWSLNPETYISSGPFTVGRLDMDQNCTLIPNVNYKGSAPKPFLERIEYNPVAQGLILPAYMEDRINIVGGDAQLDAPDIAAAQADPALADQIHSYGHFQTYYVGMNTFEAPFNNLKLRQAITHAIDRDTLANAVLPGLITPAYTMLMKGFPGEHVDELKDYQKYDVELAKNLLAEAGYPGGQGLPPLEMWMRGSEPSARDLAAAEAVAAMLQQNLGITVSVRPTDTQTFNDELYAKRTIMYFLPYQFDFLEASNMIGIWRSTGRHAWKSEKFDELLNLADTILDDPEYRDDVFRQAEVTLLEDAPAAFVFHPLNYHMWKPYVVGSDLEPNAAGFRAVVYLNTNVHRTVYINNLIGS